MFSTVYVERVLGPAFENWKFLYSRDASAVHRAHLVGLVEAGILDTLTGSTIARAIEAIDREFVYPQVIPDNVEDLYFVFERELESRVGSELAAFLHTARSRNDMDTTVFRLALKRALSGTARAALAAIRVAAERADLAAEGANELTVLYTHGQPANVSTIGHYLGAIAADLAEDLEELTRSIGMVDRSTMGACAITGTGFALNRGRVAALLGFAGIVSNTYQAISTSHWLTRPTAALEEFLRDLVRVSADLLHKSSCEVGLFEFPDSLVQSSSIMPQKRNPVIIEHLRIQAGMALGACASTRQLFNAAPYQDVNEVADAPVSSLIASLAQAESAAALFAEIAANVTANEKRAREIARAFGVTTTELADEMVRKVGVGFRTAHRACAAFARSGGDLRVLRDSFQAQASKELPFTDEEIERILDPRHFVEVRKIEGGPAPEGMLPSNEKLRDVLARAEASLDSMAERERLASAELEIAWRGLLA